MPATVVLREIVRWNSSIRALKVFEYVDPPPVQSRTNTQGIESDLLSSAIRLRSDSNLPFWPCLVAECLRSGIMTEGILDAITTHQSHQHKVEDVSRDQILAGHFEVRSRDLSSGSCLAVTSCVEMTVGSTKHMPLLDFRCVPSTNNQEIIIAILRRLIPNGWILFDSGRSYHAWGTQLLDTEKFLDLLARSLFFAPAIDQTFIAHQLLERRAALRISGDSNGRREPMIVWTDSEAIVS